MADTTAVLTLPHLFANRLQDTGLEYHVHRDGSVRVLVPLSGGMPSSDERARSGRVAVKVFDQVKPARAFAQMNLKLRSIPVAQAGHNLRVLEWSQPWDTTFVRDYHAGQTILVLDRNGAPVAAYRKRGN